MKCLEIGTQQRIRPVRDGMILYRGSKHPHMKTPLADPIIPSLWDGRFL